MTDQRKHKKRKVMLPRKPVLRPLSAKLSGLSRAGSVSDTGREHSQSSGRYVITCPVDPALESTAYKNDLRVESSEPGLSHIVAPDFENASIPCPGSKSIVNIKSSNSDDTMIVKHNVVLQTNSDDLDGRPSKHTSNAGSKGKGKAPLNSGLDLDAVAWELGSNDEGTEGSDDKEPDGSDSDTDWCDSSTA
ncbi:hypothetical protein RSAG8_09200, partial [Rhizoctonia solani AG-8 WAC10335]